MIKVKVKQDGNYVRFISITGHANYDDYGKDIVCAAVSSISITSVNLALKLDEKKVSYKDEKGYLEINILKTNDTINKVFLNMIDMLKELEKDYKKNIKITNIK